MPVSTRRQSGKLAPPRPAGFFGRHANIVLYVPNLIGYLRIACYVGSLVVAFQNTELCLFLYFLGFFGDLLDGKAARALNQSSTLGAVLDMVSDRMATSSLLVLLSHLYPNLWLGFVLLMVLDLASHWFQMYSSLLENRHHKEASGSGLFLVNFYYTHYWFFGYCCVGAETLYLALLLLSKERYRSWPLVGLPLDGAMLAPALGDGFEGPLSLASLVLLLCAPGWAIKQIVNVSQLCSSADIIVQYDLAKRN